jgi:hypothetical protein
MLFWRSSIASEVFLVAYHSAIVAFRSEKPTFSHGIVAFNGWPSNALRRDDH